MLLIILILDFFLVLSVIVFTFMWDRGLFRGVLALFASAMNRLLLQLNKVLLPVRSLRVLVVSLATQVSSGILVRQALVSGVFVGFILFVRKLKPLGCELNWVDFWGTGGTRRDQLDKEFFCACLRVNKGEVGYHRP